ncbi:MAG: hypothetical protein WBW84_19465 [Acidobacteriaceae bacterium]
MMTHYEIEPRVETTRLHIDLLLRQHAFELHQPLPPKDIAVRREWLERIASCRYMASAIVAGILEKPEEMTDEDTAAATLLLDAATFFQSVLGQHRKDRPASARPKNSFAMGMLLCRHFPGMSLATARALADRCFALRARVKEQKAASATVAS